MIVRKMPFRAMFILSATVLTAAGATSSGAQKAVVPAQGRGSQFRYTYGGGGVQQMSPVQITHQTLKNAARLMESALPIYGGNRHRAIALTHLAEQELRQAVVSAAGGTGGAQSTARRLTAAQRAAQVPKSPEIAAMQYSPQQIQASNARMQQGLQLLQQGMQQIQALGRDPGNHASDAVEFAGMAAQSANQGLQSIANRR
jgi:hypothetical protein